MSPEQILTKLSKAIGDYIASKVQLNQNSYLKLADEIQKKEDEIKALTESIKALEETMPDIAGQLRGAILVKRQEIDNIIMNNVKTFIPEPDEINIKHYKQTKKTVYHGSGGCDSWEEEVPSNIYRLKSSLKKEKQEESQVDDKKSSEDVIKNCIDAAGHFVFEDPKRLDKFLHKYKTVKQVKPDSDYVDRSTYSSGGCGSTSSSYSGGCGGGSTSGGC